MENLENILFIDLRKGMKVVAKDKWSNINRESGDPNLVVPHFKVANKEQMEVKEYVAINSRFQGDSSGQK